MLQYPSDEELSRDNARADPAELTQRQSVINLLAAHAEGAGPTSSAAILTAIAHRRTAEHHRYLRGLERLLVLDEQESDARLAAAIDSAVASELHACFQSSSRSSRYCVL